MNNLPPSNNLDEVIDYVTGIKTFKQLFIFLMIVINLAGIYDIIFNQAAGLQSLIRSYQMTIRSRLHPDRIDYINNLVAAHPGSQVSVLEAVPFQLPGVDSYKPATHVVFKDPDSGIRYVVLIGDSTPNKVKQQIVEFLESYGDNPEYSISVTTLEPSQPKR